MREPGAAGYMGATERQLFYRFHAPQGAQARPFGFVLCPPFGREYIFAHRSFRQWAVRLSRAGFPVLRFDYFGSGDSAGGDDEGSVEQWLDDISTAVSTFGKVTAGAPVCLAGLRVGASLATLHATRHQDVDGLILWDPVVNGDRYVATLISAHERWRRLQLWRTDSPPPADGTREIVGFLLSPRLEVGLRAIDLGNLSRAPAARALLMSSSPQPDPDAFGDRLAALGMTVERQHVLWPEFWSEAPDLGDVLMPPARVLQAMIAWAQAGTP